MDILERLRRIKKGLWIAVGVAFGVLFLLIAVALLAALVLHSWDTRNLQKTVKTQLGMELISIPSGTFLMGWADARNHDESPAHQVTISRGFLIGKYEVTAGEWKTVMGKEPPGFTADYLPAQFITWNDAQEFIRRLNQKNDGYIYRLPTEAEWEYACRAGTKSAFSFGDTISTDQANYNGNTVFGNGQKGVYRERPVPVGSFPANAFGLCDMHGNCNQWCQDWYDHNYYRKSPRNDPVNETASAMRVLRSGSWGSYPGICRSAHRSGSTPDYRNNTIGFRVVMSLP